MKISALKSPITEDGTWTDLDDFEGVRVCVRTTDYPPYTSAIQRNVERAGRKGKDPSVRGDIALQAVAKHILVDWENITDDNGAPVPFDRERAVEWSRDLTNYRRFFGAVLAASIQVTNDITREREDLGNS